MKTIWWLARRRALDVRRSICCALLVAAVPLWAAQLPSSSSAETDRLFAVAKVWATVKYFHPYLADRPIDWDKALIDALPQIRSARETADLKIALGAMLSVLNDPLTRVMSGGEKLAVPSQIAPQRTRIHNGLAPHTKGPGDFYSGVIERSAAPVSVMSQSVGEDLSVAIRLSEPITGSRPVSASKIDDEYSRDPYPSVEFRLLGAFRLWGAVHYFFAYKDLMDEDWDAAFARLLPKFVSAANALEYNLAVSELVKTLADSHATVQSAQLSHYFGESPPGLRLRLIDRKPVVTDILDQEAKTGGVHVGDLLTKLDGEALPERVRRQASYIAGSTQQGLGVLVCQRVLNGPEGSIASLTVSSSKDASSKEIALKRSSSYLPGLVPQREGEPVRILGKNIGYIDMDRLEQAGVDGAFDRLRNTDAIIFDLRGRFRPSVHSVASRLTSRSNVTAAIVNGPVLLEPDAPHADSNSYSASYFSSFIIRQSGLPKYKGKVVALVDERTADEAEYAALFLESAAKIQYVGSPSAGVVGKSTNLALPGGILVSFSGQDVRHANGGPLQRLGIQPNVSAPTTLAGIREGKDEALAKALESLTGQ